MNLVELQNKIHQQNRELGWWDQPRQFSTFVCLFHSELSEAMEGDRKGLMDDHLTQYPMFQVELADFVIRCLDWLGSNAYRWGVDNLNGDNFEDIDYSKFDEIELIARLHNGVSMSFAEYIANNKLQIFDAVDGIASCVEVCLWWCKSNEVDLGKIILEKVEYNKHRADHKRENRAKDGGKKY